jgi:purine/pyrimidine-nucleoside phosphorylase
MFKTNEYFDGKVKSLAFQTETLPATVGVMAPGEYVFNTSEKETMTVVSGSMAVTLPGETAEQTFHAGESFEVVANSSFDVSVTVDTAYLCLYG